MSVDTSVSIGVGFLVTQAQFDVYRETVANEENYGDEELLEKLVSDQDCLSFGAGGSYYDNDPMTYWITVSRLTATHDTGSILGGVVGLSKPVITLVEREQLNHVAAIFGITHPEIGQFMSVLWY